MKVLDFFVTKTYPEILWTLVERHPATSMATLSCRLWSSQWTSSPTPLTSWPFCSWSAPPWLPQTHSVPLLPPRLVYSRHTTNQVDTTIKSPFFTGIYGIWGKNGFKYEFDPLVGCYARWVTLTPSAVNMIFFCFFSPWIEKLETDSPFTEFCLLSRSKRVWPHRDSDYLA